MERMNQERYLLDGWDGIDGETIEGVLETLVIRGVVLVDNLLLAVRE